MNKGVNKTSEQDTLVDRAHAQNHWEADIYKETCETYTYEVSGQSAVLHEVFCVQTSFSPCEAGAHTRLKQNSSINQQLAEQSGKGINHLISSSNSSQQPAVWKEVNSSSWNTGILFVFMNNKGAYIKVLVSRSSPGWQSLPLDASFPYMLCCCLWNKLLVWTAHIIHVQVNWWAF